MSKAMEILQRVQSGNGGQRLVERTVPPTTTVNAAAQAPKATAPTVEVPSSVDNTGHIGEPPKFSVQDVTPSVEPQKADAPEPTQEAPNDFIPNEYLPDDIDPADEIDKLIDVSASTGKNFKALRTKTKSLNKELGEIRSQLDEARLKLQEYDSGLAVPSLFQQQADRIAALERFERLYALEESPAYHEQILNPLKGIEEKFARIAQDNNTDPELIKKLSDVKNNLELNKILSNHFQDAVSVLEAKNLIVQAQDLYKKGAELKKDPANSLVAMQQENERIVAERKLRANKAIVDSSKGAWMESLGELKADKRFPEFSYRDNDTQYNETVVRPLLTKAAQEYGRLVKGFADSGLGELPKDLAKATAKMLLLAHQSAAATIERDSLRQEVADLRKQMGTRTQINRPSVTGNNHTGMVTRAGGAKANPARAAFERGNGRPLN